MAPSDIEVAHYMRPSDVLATRREGGTSVAAAFATGLVAILMDFFVQNRLPRSYPFIRVALVALGDVPRLSGPLREGIGRIRLPNPLCRAFIVGTRIVGQINPDSAYNFPFNRPADVDFDLTTETELRVSIFVEDQRASVETSPGEPYPSARIRVGLALLWQNPDTGVYEVVTVSARSMSPFQFAKITNARPGRWKARIVGNHVYLRVDELFVRVHFFITFGTGPGCQTRFIDVG